MALAYGQRMLGRDNPNYRNAGSRICCECKRGFFSYQPRRKFCSLFCRDNSRGEYHMRMSSKKDANHWQIVRLLMAGGAFVRDTSRAFFGVPDLLVWYKGIWSFIEVKNPDTYYGRKGLNKQQRKWAEDWQGGPVFIVRTPEDVAYFLAWELDKLDQAGGGHGRQEVASRAAKNKTISKPKIHTVRSVEAALVTVGVLRHAPACELR